MGAWGKGQSGWQACVRTPTSVIPLINHFKLVCESGGSSAMPQGQFYQIGS